MSGSMSSVDFWIASAFLPILLATAFFDLREMRIPNSLSWAGLAVFALGLPFLGFDEGLSRCLVGLMAFGICFGLFAAGWLGGGDAKIFPVTILFVPPDHLPMFLFSFSAAMIAGMVAIWCVRQRLSHPEAVWVSMKPGAAFPMGISIATSLPLVLIISLLG
jgi:prepilin peptidase CpaA